MPTLQQKDDKVYYIKDHFSREARVNVDEMRLQIQTQLDTFAAEDLVNDDLRGKEQAYNYLELMVNLRTISQYNFEQLKEKIRGFTKSAVDSTDAIVKEYQPFLNYDGVVPTLEPIKQEEEFSMEDLEKEVMLLEKELAIEIEETAELKREIDDRIAEKADKSKENGIAIDKQMALLDHLESWLEEQEDAEKHKRQKVLLKDGTHHSRPITSREMANTSLKLTYEEFKPEIAQA